MFSKFTKFDAVKLIGFVLTIGIVYGTFKTEVRAIISTQTTHETLIGKVSEQLAQQNALLSRLDERTKSTEDKLQLAIALIKERK